ncbi:hypothetical protein AB0I28_00800 [Phytomonospora sp. NPDC050363]|uniref:hypothetical protein n=1 Tax=Phytomonospora sp. NPDC050363 TaxID=3155642 RepID=UPI0033D737CD
MEIGQDDTSVVSADGVRVDIRRRRRLTALCELDGDAGASAVGWTVSRPVHGDHTRHTRWAGLPDATVRVEGPGEPGLDEIRSAAAAVVDGERSERAARSAWESAFGRLHTRFAEKASRLRAALDATAPGSTAFRRALAALDAHASAMDRFGMDAQDIAAATGGRAALVPSGPKRVQVTLPAVYGHDALAARIGVDPATVSALAAQGLLPQPDGDLDGAPGWLPATVEAWTGRLGDRSV